MFSRLINEYPGTTMFVLIPAYIAIVGFTFTFLFGPALAMILFLAVSFILVKALD